MNFLLLHNYILCSTILPWGQIFCFIKKSQQMSNGCTLFFSQPFNIFILCNEICREHTYQIFLLTIILCSTPLLHKKSNMANTHPRCQYLPGVNTCVLGVYDRTAANNNGVIINASTIRQEESIQAQATDTNQHCCNEPPIINSPLDGDYMLLHGEKC
jgi:hypothetical protein